MKTLNNELIITRGESFTMDKLFQNKDGSPYIISNKLSDPYWLITISSSEFEQSKRYVKEYLLPLKEYPRFLFTNVISLNEIFTDANSFEDIKQPTSSSILTCIDVDGEIRCIEPNDYVYYLDVDGVRKYKYAKIVNNTIKWYDYECRLIKLFTSEDTNQFTAQSYMYSISLVDGDMFKPILLPTKLTVKNKL